jgi:hypothetical protein
MYVLYVYKFIMHTHLYINKLVYIKTHNNNNNSNYIYYIKKLKMF